MLRALFLALNVKPSEEKQVVLLLAKGFFMGVFITTFQVVAETLFLNRLEGYLKEAILVSGAVGILFTFLFAKLQERIKFSTLTLITQVFMFLITIACYLAFLYAPPQHQLYVTFAMFVLSGPFLALLLLSFWGIFGRMFDLRQSKRIIGGIDIGQLSAAIIASFSIPFLGKFIPYTQNFLVICAVAILLSAFCLYLIKIKFDLSKAEVSKIARRKTTFRSMFNDRYIKLLSVFLLCSMVTFTFVQYSFYEVSHIQYPSENELRNFLAIFQGSILILGLLLQTFVNDKIISEYGMKVSLMIQPFILAIFTVAVIVTGRVFNISEILNNDSFIYFFLFVALSRLFNYSLRDSLENPVFKLYFMPLDNSERFDIQTKVEGVVNESARFLAGLIILGLSYLSFIELIHYSYAIIFLLSLYFFVIAKVYNEYRNKIQLKLSDQQKEFVDHSKVQQEIVEKKLATSVQENELNRVIFNFRLLEKINPKSITSVINNLMNSQSRAIREYAQQRMNEIKGLSVSEQYIIGGKGKKSPEVRQVINGFDLDALLEAGDITSTRIATLAHSESKEDRIYAVELLTQTREDKLTNYMVELLTDNEPEVRKMAIKAARNFPVREVIMAVIYNLDDPIYANDALNTLVSIGGRALALMDNAFYKMGQSPQVMIKLTQAMGRIGGQKATQQLWNKIDYPDKVIVSNVLLALGESNFKASLTQITRIKYAIETDVSNALWNIASLEIVKSKKNKSIKKALDEEIKGDIDHIYMLLSMLYDSQSIQLVKENIESQTNEGVTYGLELLDVFLSEDMKQKILPLLDDSSNNEKIKKLEMFYPKPEYEYKLLVKLLLNRDYNQSSRYTKATVIDQVKREDFDFFKYDLIAQLFNPDRMLQELAASKLYSYDKALYEEHSERLPKDQKLALDNIIKSDNASLRYEIIMFLKTLNLFQNTEGLVITHMVDLTEERFIKEGEMLSLSKNRNTYFYIVLKGSVNLYESGNIEGSIGKGEFIGELSYSNEELKSGLIMAIEDSVLLEIPKDHFYELLSDNMKLAQNVVDYV